MKELLNIIRNALKLSSSTQDNDISRNIQACLKELERVGIKVDGNSYSDPLIISATELYCKWQWDYMGQGERFGVAFQKLRDALSLTDEYMR